MRRIDNDLEHLHGPGNFLVHSGPQSQRGYGFGSILSGLFRAAKPMISRGIKFAGRVATSKAAKKLGNRLMDTGLDVATDLLKGENPRGNIDKNIEEAKEEIISELQAAKSGKRAVSKRRRKRHGGRRLKHRYNPTNRSERYDIMDEDTESE